MIDYIIGWFEWHIGEIAFVFCVLMMVLVLFVRYG